MNFELSTQSLLDLLLSYHYCLDYKLLHFRSQAELRCFWSALDPLATLFFFLKVQNKTVTLRQKDYFTDRIAQGDQLFTFSSLAYLDLRSNFSLALALPPRILLKTLSFFVI